MRSRLLEICCTSVEDAVAAERGGADRIELCEELDIGGVTPDDELFAAVKAAVGIPVFVLVRARGGDFVFEEEDVEAMCGSIELLRELGADGIVSGALKADGLIDVPATIRFIVAARPLPFTFHRAFDECPDQEAALGALKDLGVARVLTAAGKECVEAAVEDGPTILACGGLRAVNAAGFAAVDGLSEFHSAARVGNDPVDEQEVRALVAALGTGAPS